MSSRVFFAAKGVPVTACSVGCTATCQVECQHACLYACQASCLSQCEGPCTTACQSQCAVHCQTYWLHGSAAPRSIQYYCGACTVYEEELTEEVEFEPELELVSAE